MVKAIMIRENIIIDYYIPAVLWGNASDKCFIVVHGDQSNKEDTVIQRFAEIVTTRGYQVLSFDLPEHGARLHDKTICTVQNCVADLDAVMKYVLASGKQVSLFAVSMGAYFSLLSFHNQPLQRCLFLSPVVDMGHLIDKMMHAFGVTEAQLKARQEIATPIGKTLYWDYYTYVKEHPVTNWPFLTDILYGEQDAISEYGDVLAFCGLFNCDLEIMPQGEHHFHTQAQLDLFCEWVSEQF